MFNICYHKPQDVFQKIKKIVFHYMLLTYDKGTLSVTSDDSQRTDGKQLSN